MALETFCTLPDLRIELAFDFVQLAITISRQRLDGRVQAALFDAFLQGHLLDGRLQRALDFSSRGFGPGFTRLLR